MSTEFLKNAKKLGKSDLKNVTGGVIGPVGGGKVPKECGCSCTGAVTGPSYCSYYIACRQEMTC